MGRLFFTLLGAFLGFWAGAMIGTFAGMIWVSIFPSPDLPTNPQAGMDIAFGAGMAGEALGILAGGVMGWRKGTLKHDAKSV